MVGNKRDTYINSGTNFGQIGPSYNFGAQPFVMSDERIANVARQLKADVLASTLAIQPVGSGRSATDAHRLADGLRAEGLDVFVRGLVSHMSPNPSQPIEMHHLPTLGRTLTVASHLLDNP